MDARSAPPVMPSTPDALPPGRQLSRAREAQQLSITDVADILRFSERQIATLEADDYGALPGATFVRGFIRSYAKLVRLDAAQLLALLPGDAPVNTPEFRPPSNMGQAERTPLLGASFSWRNVLLVFVLLAALAGAAYYFMTESVLPEAAPAVAPVATAPAPVVVPPSVAPLAAAAPAAPGGADSTASLASPPAESASANALILEFDATSWAEIRDASQKVLFSGEYPKGTRQVVNGKAPYQVWIGKASAVRVLRGDRIVDLKPFTREDVARLTVE